MRHRSVLAALLLGVICSCRPVAAPAPTAEITTDMPEVGDPPPTYPQRYDADGDPLPPGALARFGAPRFRTVPAFGGQLHGRQVVFTPDGTQVMMATAAGRVAFYDTASGKLNKEWWLGPTYGTHSTPALSEDGSLAYRVERADENTHCVRV